MESLTLARSLMWIVAASLMMYTHILTVEGTQTTESYVTSSHSIQRLASLNLTSNVKAYIAHEERRLRIIKNFSGHEDQIPFVKQRIRELKVIHKSLLKNGTSKQFRKSFRENHPTTVLAALRNFLGNWETKLANRTIYGNRLQEFLEANDTKPLPTRKDLHLIGTAITIVQATYNLSIADLVNGVVLGKKGEPLSHADCYDIGKSVLRVGLLDTAYDWLEASIKGYDLEKLNTSELTFNFSDALASIARIAFKRKDQARSLKLFEKAYELGGLNLVTGTHLSIPLQMRPGFRLGNDKKQKRISGHESDSDNLLLYQEFVKHRFGRDVEPLAELNREDVEPWRKKFYSMCQNSTNATWLQEQRLLRPKLSCRIRFSKTSPYVVYKEEIISKSPYISVILDFMSKAETNRLKNATLPLLKETVLFGFDPYVLWHFKAANVKDNRSKYVADLSVRAGEVAGLDVYQPSQLNFAGDPVQIIDFGISGLALPHEEIKLERYPNQRDRMRGQARSHKLATLHVFLSNVSAGGATVFIEQNITVIPKQGAALLWYNYKPSGEAETNMFSAVCPLAVGQNVVAEKGIWVSHNYVTSYCGRRSKSTHFTANRIQSCHPALCR